MMIATIVEVNIAILLPLLPEGWVSGVAVGVLVAVVVMTWREEI